MVKFFIKYAIWKFELNFESSIPSLILGFEDTLHCVYFFLKNYQLPMRYTLSYWTHTTYWLSYDLFQFCRPRDTIVLVLRLFRSMVWSLYLVKALYIRIPFTIRYFHDNIKWVILKWWPHFTLMFITEHYMILSMFYGPHWHILYLNFVLVLPIDSVSTFSFEVNCKALGSSHR
jgi:hypothetical protein